VRASSNTGVDLLALDPRLREVSCRARQPVLPSLPRAR